MTTLVSIATYNEMANLPALVDAIFQQLPDAQLLVIDDASPDGTGRWCDERAAADDRLRVIHRPGKLGLGTATVQGLQYAVEHDYRYVVTMDADFSHDPRYLPELVASMESGSRVPGPLDVMIGSRYTRGGGVQGSPLSRRVTSRALNRFARFWLGLKVRDTSGAFRCYRTSALRQIPLDRIQSRGYSVFEELLMHLTRADARMSELPIVFVDRARGQSKVTPREALSSLYRLIRLRFG